MLNGKHIILGITGGIAVYKSAELVRLLKKQGARVSVVMTEGAKEFVTPLTFATLSGEPVYDSLWLNRAGADSNIAHINLSREADAMLIAPCTANVMAKIAHGMSDDLLSNLVLARDRGACPLAIAPAMNVQMWDNPATQRNLAQIMHDGIHIFGPAHGDQACGEIGAGRMLEPAEIVSLLPKLFTPQSLAGKRVLITAGPTFEAIDPVRGITNHSSGKMGYALAHAAQCAGASVTLISGKTALSTPYGVTRIDVQSADEMLSACQNHLAGQDIFIAVAAVADWRVAQVANQKIKKANADDVPSLEFVQTPDILATIANSPNAPYCVGFAAESEHVIEYAQAKRIKKNIPLMIANQGPATFGSEYNQVSLVTAKGVTTLPNMRKDALAQQLIQAIAEQFRSSQK
ncbi:MAG: bifunctional phosphopantothenoylcysteine decarboxylase/phosphopantothenate--cysteine ligase CoaBC [Burkholderiales bacterium]|nr:bifunctional phosphopantothenoylcysteine decarboxylase/phosphopantothenate--cysteine ligase CoaBC [Burkholderiales bacterium]